MHLADVYRQSRERMLALAPQLTPDQQQTTVPASPSWTVADVYRHLTGLPVDVFASRMGGDDRDAWTAAQVDARAGATLEEVCAEWAEIGPKFEERIHGSGFELARPVIDVWTHEQDVLGALGRTGDRDDPALPTLNATLLAMLRKGWSLDTSRPPIEFVVDGEAHRYGEGEPQLSLRTSAYEFARLALSRRSRAQMLAAGWTAENPERVFALIAPFPLPEHDLTD